MAFRKIVGRNQYRLDCRVDREKQKYASCIQISFGIPLEELLVAKANEMLFCL